MENTTSWRFTTVKNAAENFTTSRTSHSSKSARRVVVIVLDDPPSSRNTRYVCILLYPFRTMCFKQFAMNVRYGLVVRCSFWQVVKTSRKFKSHEWHCETKQKNSSSMHPKFLGGMVKISFKRGGQAIIPCRYSSAAERLQHRRSQP